jgi:hypothetical protein
MINHPVISALGRLKLENCKIEVSLGYIVKKPKKKSTDLNVIFMVGFVNVNNSSWCV